MKPGVLDGGDKCHDRCNAMHALRYRTFILAFVPRGKLAACSRPWTGEVTRMPPFVRSTCHTPGSLDCRSLLQSRGQSIKPLFVVQ